MYRVVSGERLSRAAVWAGLCGMGVWVLWRPDAVSNGVAQGLSVCGSVLIPALLPFLLLGGMAVRTGLCVAVGRRCDGFSRAVFGLSGNGFGCFLLSLVGGFLSGAVTVTALYRAGGISEEEARRTLRVSVCAGPGFLVGGVGSALCGSAAFGLLLWAANAVAAILLAVGQRCLCPPLPRGEPTAAAPQSPGDAFVETVGDACRALLTGCGFVILFAALASLVGTLPLPPFAVTLFAAVTEVSGGCLAIAGGGGFPALLLGICAGWGGLSVHAQIAALTAGFRGVDGGYYNARLLHALLGGGISLLLFSVVPLPDAVFRNFSDAVFSPVSVSVATSVATLAMTALFLFTGRRSVAHIERSRRD